MIRFFDVKVVYHKDSRDAEGRCVLNLPRLNLEEGCRYALIGPNGAGKSTLIKLLAQLIEPTSGTIEMGGIGDRIGYLPQKPFMFAGTVLRNVTLGLPRADNRTAQALAALDKVGMREFQKERSARLSGGEAQRVALARVIAQERRMILLDEPTSATDIAGEAKIEEALTAYWRESGCTLVSATHSPAQAGRLADEIIVLENGVIAEKNEAHQLLESPKNPTVRTFLNYWRLGDRTN